MKGFRMKRALLDLARDTLMLVTIAIFLVVANVGSAGIAALLIAARAGQ